MAHVIFAAIICILAVWSFSRLLDSFRVVDPISYSTFLEHVKLGNVAAVRVVDTTIYGTFKHNSESFETVMPNDATVWDTLRHYNVDIVVTPSKNRFSFSNLAALFGAVILIMFIWSIFQQLRGGGIQNQIANITKSKARLYMPSDIKDNFDSVAGMPEAKEELADVIDFLKNPEKYKRLGAKLTRGILLTGAPGTGKTLLARAVAGEAQCPFFSISGSAFVEMYVGVGSARVRSLFAQAREYAPCILFIDEIDAVGKQRGLGAMSDNDEKEQTLNQLLTEMDGFDSGDSSVIVVAATNRPEVLDKALLRPGRFDRQVQVPYPDVASRKAILDVHAKKVAIGPDVKLEKIAQGTPGFTGADLANLINEAAIYATRHDQDSVCIADFEEARDKMLLGKKWLTTHLTDHERKMVAYHEAGHALIVLLLPELLDPLYKVTILPRGQALGVTHSLPDREKHSVSKDEQVAQIMRALGGRVAEELVFDKLESGAASDFQHATQIAYRMVCQLGMSKELGPIEYDPSGKYKYSEETARLIDSEVRSLVSRCYNETVNLLDKNREKLDTLAQALLEKETLFAGDIYSLLNITPREEYLFQ